MENKAVIIGIAGGSASGKTSIAQSIYDRFKGSHRVKIIKQDDYYKDQSDKTMEERVKTNYDHPFAFDNDLLVSDLKKLKKKERIFSQLFPRCLVLSIVSYKWSMENRKIIN